MKDFRLDRKADPKYILDVTTSKDTTRTEDGKKVQETLSVKFADGRVFKNVNFDEENIAKIIAQQEKQAKAGVGNISVFEKRKTKAGVMTGASIIGGPVIGVAAAAMAGALLGFLKYNKPKAEVFLGDTGSLAIGGLLGTLAIMGKFEIYLVVLAGVFVIECLSVMIQVTSFKLTGKRVFKMSPIHHHFELSGYTEKQIVKGFAIASCIFGAMAVIIFQLFHAGVL